MTLPLSAKQLRVLEAFRAFAAREGRAPSVRELGAKLGGLAPATVHQYLTILEERGLLRNDGDAHGRRLAGKAARAAALERPGPTARVVIRGTIAAGRPIEAIEESDEVLELPRAQVGAGEVFALRVRGDSMVDDHILDGDLVLVRAQSKVDDGEIAVALLDDGSATLKRVYRERARRRVRLQPANAAHKPIYARDLRIQGKVVGVWRTAR